MHLNNPEMFQSLCWTLVHSLWQGLVLALLGGITVVLTRKTSALLRYNLLALLGLVFILGVGSTFYIQIQTNNNETLAKPVTHQPHAHLESSQGVLSPVLVTYKNNRLQPQLQQQRSTVIDGVAGFLDANAVYIVALWFLVFVYKCLRLFGGLRQIHRLRHSRVSAVSAEWENRLETLKHERTRSFARVGIDQGACRAGLF